MKVEKCKNCSYYAVYYKRCTSHYSKLSHGYCRKKQAPQKQSDTCGDFRDSQDLDKQREERLLKNLEWSLKSINDMSQILKEKIKEKK